MYFSHCEGSASVLCMYNMVRCVMFLIHTVTVHICLFALAIRKMTKSNKNARDYVQPLYCIIGNYTAQSWFYFATSKRLSHMQDHNGHKAAICKTIMHSITPSQSRPIPKRVYDCVCLLRSVHQPNEAWPSQILHEQSFSCTENGMNTRFFHLFACI